MPRALRTLWLMAGWAVALLAVTCVSVLTFRAFDAGAAACAPVAATT